VTRILQREREERMIVLKRAGDIVVDLVVVVFLQSEAERREISQV